MREHGGDIYLASRETGIPVSEIIDFSASINPLGVPDTVAAAIQDYIQYLPHYPEPFADQLTADLGVHLDIDPQTILCGNGSTELIYLVVRALAPGRVLIPEPTFSEYERACSMQRGTSIAGHRLAREYNFDIDPDAYINAMAGCDMAFLCNPNNPTGRLLQRDAVDAIAAEAERMSCYLVVDEAFIDFVPGYSVLDRVAGRSHLIVLRSLTKFYALSGLRIGYGVFPGALAAFVKKYKEPWTTNALAQTAGIAAISDTAYQEKTMTLIQGEKQFLEAGLRSAGIAYTPSAANYYLISMEIAGEVIVSLRKKGMLVRDCSNFPGLGGSFIRIAVRSRKESEALLRELGKHAQKSSDVRHGENDSIMRN